MGNEQAYPRRTALRLTGIATATALVAGCTGNGDDDTSSDDNNAADDDNNGTTEGETADKEGSKIDPGTKIELGGQTGGWVGVAPEEIADEENPTLRLEAGKAYTIGWNDGDGSTHNITIWNDDEEVVDGLETMPTTEASDDQYLSFTASSEMTQYVCDIHSSTMVGTLKIE